MAISKRNHFSFFKDKKSQILTYYSSLRGTSARFKTVGTFKQKLYLTYLATKVTCHA